MANPEHLAILKKGVETWNKWRRQNLDVNPELSRANLSGADLSRAYLRDARLRVVNLRGANLVSADLARADLLSAELGRANFNRADLREVRLYAADLSNADLREADLTKADLSYARLVGADLSGARLNHADLPGARLNQAHLSGAHLEEADLIAADMVNADLKGAHLARADLNGTNLNGADLRHAVLSFCQLCRCNLTGAKLTGANLYATARDDWIIEGIECRYVFWDVKSRIRSPQDRDLAPGEFERLYRTLPTIEYIFQNGMSPMDPLIMDRVVEAIRKQNPEYDIKIDSISARGLAPSIKFTVQQQEHKEPALQMIVAGYESRMQRLEAEKDRLYDLLGRAIDKAGTRLIEAGPGAVVAMDNAIINIDQHVEYITNLRDAVAAQPEDSPTFAKVAKKTALDIIGSALKDIAKGRVKKAAEQIIELGKDLGPVILKTAAYAFFKNIMQGG